MKRANGMGTIVKLTGNRRKPYAIRKVIGWKDNGRPKLKYISYHRTYRDAVQALNAYNNDPYTVSRLTLSDIYNEWYAIREKEKAQNTLYNYQSGFNHLAPLHNIRMNDIDRAVLQKFYDDLDVSRTILHKIMSLVNQLIDFAVKKGVMPVSAVNLNKSINIPVKPDTRQNPRTVFTDNEIMSLWDKAPYDDTAKIILIYIYTGLRFSELKNLSADDVHDDYINIRQAKTAAGVRMVPLSDKVKSLLPIPHIPSHTAFDRHFKIAAPDHVIHDTRHTFITLMTEKGVDPRIIKAIVGHKLNDITAHYTHISLQTMIDAVNMI